MNSVSMEDLSQIEAELLQPDDEGSEKMDCSNSIVPEKSEEKPQLDPGASSDGADVNNLPDKKNDEKSNDTQVKTEPTTVGETITGSHSGAAKPLGLPADNDDADDDDDANMEPVVLGSYTIKDLTIKDPTDTEINTKDLFKGTIQLLIQILGKAYKNFYP